MQIGKFLKLCGVLSCFISFSPATAESEYPPPPYHEDEQICQHVQGTPSIMVCLANHLNEAEESLDRVLALFKEGGSTSDDSPFLAALEKGQRRWLEDMQATCDETLEIKYARGSMARTAPIRCRFVMTKERERLLRILHYRQIRYFEQGLGE